MYLHSCVVLLMKKYVVQCKKNESRIQIPSHPTALASLNYLVFCFWQCVPKVWAVTNTELLEVIILEGFSNKGQSCKEKVSMGAAGHSFSTCFPSTRILAPPP